MELLKQASSLILTQQCVDEYFVKFNFFDVDCFKSSLSKCLGIALILGSVLVKLPQILKIWKNKSGEGISLVSVIMDLCALIISFSYAFVKQFPFSSWGDTAFLTVQTYIIGLMVLGYAKRKFELFQLAVGVLAVCYVLMSGLTPVGTLWTLQGFNIPILLCGKLAQAYTNLKNGHTGQLSAITILMLFGGSLARIFTSIQETGDTMVIATYCASTFANSVILLQMLYYWNVDVNEIKKKTE